MRLNRPLAVITVASAALVCFAPLSWALGKEEGGRTTGVQLSNIIKQPPELQKYLNQNRKNPRDLTESELQIVTEFASVGSTGDKLICTAFRSAKYSKSQVSAVRERATSACFVASLANGEIEASTQLKTTKISSMAGKILLTLRLNSKMVTTVRPTPAPTQTVTPIPSPTQTVTPIPTPTPTVRPTPSPAPTTTPIPNPTPKPDASRVVSEAQREVWRQLIVAFGLQVDSLVDIITKLEASRVPEQNKLDVAIQYGDTLREGIQKDVIASIDAKIASWTSDKIFYESLIKTYQTKIEDSLKGPVSAGPNRAQIDSWMRLITLHQSSISWNDSQISSTKAELKKYASWRSVAVRYGDERRVNEIDAMISDANLQIAKLQASNSEYNALIAELRLKIAG